MIVPSVQVINRNNLHCTAWCDTIWSTFIFRSECHFCPFWTLNPIANGICQIEDALAKML